MSTETPFPTNIVVAGETLFCSSATIASQISTHYSENREGNPAIEDNTLGGRITHPGDFVEGLAFQFENCKFAWRINSGSTLPTVPAAVQKTPEIALSVNTNDFQKVFDGMEMGKKLSLLIYRYAWAMDTRVSTGQLAGFTGSAIGVESLKVSKVLRANADVRLISLTDAEKELVKKEELSRLIVSFNTVRENVLIYSPPEFLYFALDYSDFTIFAIEGGGYLIFMDQEYCIFDNNYGVQNKSATFDSRLFQHKIKIDYWMPNFAKEFMIYSRFVDMGKISNNTMTVKFNFSAPPFDYPGLENSGIDVGQLSGEVMKMFKVATKTVLEDVHVGTHTDWYSPARHSLGLTSLLRRCDPLERARLCGELVKLGSSVTAPLTDLARVSKASFKQLADILEAEYLKFFIDEIYTENGEEKKTKRWSTVSEFIDQKGIENTISHISKTLSGITTLSDSFAGVPMPSVGQWHRWVDVGRAMRSRLPSGNIGKEYAPLRGYSSEVKGASTGRKNEKSLTDFVEFFPGAVEECSKFNYVGITTNDHMLSNNWLFWLTVQGNDREKATASFAGYDQNELGTNVLKGDDKFELRQGVNFTAIPFQKLVDLEFTDTKQFLYNDAYIVHSKDGLGYNPGNPFASKTVPNWPALVGKDDFPSATEAENGLYNYLSWCTFRYKAGVVKFHLDKNVSAKFWRVMGKRLLSKCKEFMLWKCGRPHNLEFHFFFNTVPLVAKPVAVKVGYEGAGEEGGEQGQKVPILVEHVAPTVDRWSIKREKALYYWTCIAALAELHRMAHYFNPAVELGKQEIMKKLKAGDNYVKIVSDVPSGFYDPSYSSSRPQPVSIPYGDRVLKGIEIYGTGANKLVKGLNVSDDAEDAQIVEAAEAMKNALKATYGEGPVEGDGVIPTGANLPPIRPKTKKQKKAEYFARLHAAHGKQKKGSGAGKE